MTEFARVAIAIQWPARLRNGAVDALLLGTIVLGSAVGLARGVAELQPGSLMWAGVLAAGCAFLAPRLDTMTPARLRALVIGATLGALLLRIAYVVLIEVAPQGDFRQIWEFAMRFAADPRHVRPDMVEELRGVPYLAPLARLGGGNPLVVQVTNCVVVALTSLMAFRLASRHLGETPAALGVILAGLAFEPTMASELLTHDIPGALGLLAALLMFDSLDRRTTAAWGGWPVLGLGGLLGLVLLVLNIQRGLAPFVLAAAFVVAVRPDLVNWLRRSLLMVVIPGTVLSLAGRVLDRGLGIDAAGLLERHRWYWMGAYANTATSGTFKDLAPLWPVYERMGTEEIRDQALSLAASDLADRAVARPLNYLGRVTLLHRLGSQLYLYQPPEDSIPAPARQASRSLIAGTQVFMLAAVLVGLTRLLRRPNRLYEFPLVSLAVLIASLGLLGEAQPRYLFPYWFLLTPVAAFAFVRLDGGPGPGEPPVRRLLDAALVGASAVALIAVVSVVVDRTYGMAEGRVLRIPMNAIRGVGSVERRYTAVLDPPRGASARLDLTGRFPPSGELGLIALREPATGGCTPPTLAVHGAGAAGRTQMVLDSSRALHFTLPVDSIVLVANAGAMPPCRAKLTRLRRLTGS